MEGEMEDDVKTRFEDLDKRLSSTEKRIDDIKWFISGVTGLFTIVFGLVAVLGNLNFNAEKAAIRDFQRDIKSEFGKMEPPPVIDLLGIDSKPLEGQEVAAGFEKSKESGLFLVINLSLTNSGDSLSGPMYVKVYSPGAIRLLCRSTDEQKFKYETYTNPEELRPNQIPGKYSTEWYLRVWLADGVVPPPGKYPFLIKVFYGKGKVTQAHIVISVEQDHMVSEIP
jgi:hypothetical protein